MLTKVRPLPNQLRLIGTHLVYEFIDDIPEPLVGQLQRSRAISICRRTQVIGERLSLLSKSSGRTGAIDKEQNNFPEVGDTAADE